MWTHKKTIITIEQYRLVQKLGLGCTVGFQSHDVMAGSRGGGRRWYRQLLGWQMFLIIRWEMTLACVCVCIDRGLSPATCEKIYIDTARYLDTYGVHMFPATWVSSLSVLTALGSFWLCLQYFDVVGLMPLPPHHLLVYRNSEWFNFLVPAYWGWPGKEAVKWVSACSGYWHQRADVPNFRSQWMKSGLSSVISSPSWCHEWCLSTRQAPRLVNRGLRGKWHLSWHVRCESACLYRAS